MDYTGKKFKILQDENHLGAGIKKGDIFECVGMYKLSSDIQRVVLKYPKGLYVTDLDKLEELA